MESDNYRPTILCAEPDQVQQKLLICAHQDAQAHFNIVFVNDGRELLNYLKRQGKYADPEKYPVPSLVLTEINLKSLSALEVLRILRSDPDNLPIPFIGFSNLSIKSKIAELYCAGVVSYIMKPIAYQDLIQIVRSINDYWLSMVSLPIA